MEMAEYFNTIESGVKQAYAVAEAAREQGKDPEQHVDIPIAEDLPEKAENLVCAALFPELKDNGIKQRIRELEEEYGKKDERVALTIGKEVAQQTFYEFEEQEEAVSAGIRIGLAYLTGAVVTAPLDGIADIKIRENDDGSEYVAVYYAGPIRSAGGTASALSVLLADYIRKEVGLARYKPRDKEVERYAIEVEDYTIRVTKKQYTPDRKETKMIARNVPIEVTGIPTEGDMEVSNYKDLERVETNGIRGGMCLVYLDGLPLKAPKILSRLEKFGDEFGLEHWQWLEEYLELQKKMKAAAQTSSSKEDAEQDTVSRPKTSSAYMENITAGRPVFAHPGRTGGFRLRYGRSRTAGLAQLSFHPVTMYLTEQFMAIGTQIRLEYPGKATVATPCDTIEPPMVKLKNGDVVRVETVEQAKQIEKQVEEILFLGDILVPFGEFLENGKKLLPAGYCEEWWAQELLEAVEKEVEESESIEEYVQRSYVVPDADTAIALSKQHDVPLHPYYTYHWNGITGKQFKQLHAALRENTEKTGETLHLTVEEDVKEVLEQLGVPHTVDNGVIQLGSAETTILTALLQLGEHTAEVVEQVVEENEHVLDMVAQLASVPLRDKYPVFLGGRMGRPEKAGLRKMKGSPQLLFPSGYRAGGRMRNLMQSYQTGGYKAEVCAYYCDDCEKVSCFSYCVTCGETTAPLYICRKCGDHTFEPEHCDQEATRRIKTELPIQQLVDKAAENVGIRVLPDVLKSPRAVTGKHRHVEPIEKGLLREKYDLYVNKDGTIRYDASDLALTHFKPCEVSTPLEKLRELGYTQDINGDPLEAEDQVLALKPQHIELTDAEEGVTGGEYLVNIAKFVDDLLEDFYGLEPYYNAKTREDLVGSLVIGLAPHTSGGIIGRIIGFTPAKGIYAHPYWHAAKRRNADGDEDSVLLLMDALLNFSRKFLPDHIGGRSMDAPLILASILKPDEVDEESWNVDVESVYPREFFEKTWECPKPYDVKDLIATAEDRIRGGDPFTFSYTHETTDINAAPAQSAYVTFNDMGAKVKTQLALGKTIRAVDENDVAEHILTDHFFPDIMGNLRAFSRQRFRCVDCNAKYRRVPLSGVCTNRRGSHQCGGKLLLTVYEGSIRKYLEPSEQIAENFAISTYLRQQIKMTRERIQSIFGKAERQTSLLSFK